MLTYCLALALAVAAQDDKEAEKAATDALEQFQKAYKGGDDERRTAIEELAKVHHPKVATKLGAILAGLTPSPVRVAAARGLGAFGANKKQATAALGNAIPANVKEPNVLFQIFDAIGKLQDPSAVPLLVRYYEEKDLSLAQNAVFTTGKLGVAAGIDPLIGVLIRNEKLAKPAGAAIGVAASGTNPNQAGGVVVSGSDTNARRERAVAVVSAANTALQEITKEKLTTADAWSSWWSKNKATFNKK